MRDESLSKDQIYNCDESGLYWKALPSKTLASSNEHRAEGYKINKKRITLLLCSNASGSHKLPLLAIGNAKKPRGIGNINSLPLKYKSSSAAWMTKDLFSEWFSTVFCPEVKSKLKSLNLEQKALLILDNASVHKINFDVNGSGITTIFLPPNTTALIQPLDQGVIASFKKNYRKNMMRKLLTISTCIKSSIVECAQNFDLKQCFDLCSVTWDDLPIKAIQNSWNILNDTLKNEQLIDINQNEEIDEDNILLSLLEIDGNDMKELENMDAQDFGYKYLTTAELISESIHKPVSNDEEDQLEVECSTFPQKANTISCSEALKNLKNYIEYAETNPLITKDTVKFLKGILDLTENCRLQELYQKKITDFLPKS